MLSKVEKVDSANETGGRIGDEDLASMGGAHDTRRTVERRAEVVIAARLRLARGNPHTHR
jgi:hypothetical protein